MKNELSRRGFIKSSALFSALLAVDPFHFQRPGIKSKSNEMQERIVPVSIAWDAANLMMKDTNLSWKMMDSISEQFNKLVSGRILEKGKKHISEMFDIVKMGGGWDSETHPRVALIAGWLIYREIPPVITPLYRQDHENGALSRDAEVLKFRIARDSAGSVTKEQLEDILKLMYHRAFFRTHTLTPNRQEWENWVGEIVDWHQADREKIGELASAWIENKTTPGFFNANDELIRIANDYSIRELEISPQFLENKGDSLYARVLAKSAMAIKSLDNFFNDKITKQELMGQLNIT